MMYLQKQEPLICVCYSVRYLLMVGSCCPTDFGQLQRLVTQRRWWPVDGIERAAVSKSVIKLYD